MTRAADLDRHCGPAAVAAVFARRPQDVMRFFYVAERRREAGPHCAALARLRRPYREVQPADLARIAGTQHHGGIVALALPRAVPALDPRNPPEALRAARVTPVLDGIGNPHNLGAIARSAAFFGCRALVLSGDPRQAGLSDAAFRTSEGGLEALDLFVAADLPIALRAMSPGILTAAAVPRGGVPPAALPRDVPVALVLGNEEDGLSPATVAACALRVTLPAAGPVESLNVSVAAAVLIHALAG
ncbi:TrmH family RNA methyltransferase [Neoroseomonas oryzicola]|uniref:RNA methyltransferase n=1 Tax=Neoroseomonas oryzicola TaxID=535904 RepID=A0A9X9WIX4_9PROT|nr:RNA methyltransferase [Neoroseomonas oryzicola]NKE18029.1 RNA methyltransferase [Neoroseomonas oryzicola]